MRHAAFSLVGLGLVGCAPSVLEGSWGLETVRMSLVVNDIVLANAESESFDGEMALDEDLGLVSSMSVTALGRTIRLELEGDGFETSDTSGDFDVGGRAEVELPLDPPEDLALVVEALGLDTFDFLVDGRLSCEVGEQFEDEMTCETEVGGELDVPFVPFELPTMTIQLEMQLARQ